MQGGARCIKLSCDDVRGNACAQYMYVRFGGLSGIRHDAADLVSDLIIVGAQVFIFCGSFFSDCGSVYF